MARLTHQWADILRSDPRVGHLPSKATNQWVTPLRRNEEGYKIITAVSEATSISNWHFRAQANPLGEVFTPILLGHSFCVVLGFAPSCLLDAYMAAGGVAQMRFDRELDWCEISALETMQLP